MSEKSALARGSMATVRLMCSGKSKEAKTLFLLKGPENKVSLFFIVQDLEVQASGAHDKHGLL